MISWFDDNNGLSNRYDLLGGQTIRRLPTSPQASHAAGRSTRGNWLFRGTSMGERMDVFKVKPDGRRIRQRQFMKSKRSEWGRLVPRHVK